MSQIKSQARQLSAPVGVLPSLAVVIAQDAGDKVADLARSPRTGAPREPRTRQRRPRCCLSKRVQADVWKDRARGESPVSLRIGVLPSAEPKRHDIFNV
jgi:hypothetical protein